MPFLAAVHFTYGVCVYRMPLLAINRRLPLASEWVDGFPDLPSAMQFCDRWNAGARRQRHGMRCVIF